MQHIIFDSYYALYNVGLGKIWTLTEKWTVPVDKNKIIIKKTV